MNKRRMALIDYDRDCPPSHLLLRIENAINTSHFPASAPAVIDEIENMRNWIAKIQLIPEGTG